MTQSFKIKELGWQGDGVVEFDGERYFAPFTLSDEKITAELVDGNLSNVKIVEPSTQRVKAICKHFKSCGGCSLQHLEGTALAKWKLSKVRTALSFEGLSTEFRPIYTSLPNSRRRATFAVKRTKSDPMVGFHARASDIIIDIKECPISNPKLLEGFGAYRQMADIGLSRKGVMKVTATATDYGLDLDVTGGKDLDAKDFSKLASICENARIVRLLWNGEAVFQSEKPIVTFDGVRAFPPAGSFLQATPDGQDQLIASVVEILKNSKSAIDLFSGCGTFTLPLAKSTQVTAAESDEDMMQALEDAAKQNSGLKEITAIQRDLFRRPFLPDELKKFDAAVIDPPRAGAEAQTKELAKSTVSKIAFVSCNPTTFARDAKILVEAGFNLDWVQTVDQFLFNSHVELVASFTR